MSIRSPDINADYLQIRNITLVRGDTFGLYVRMMNNGAPVTLTENSVVTFAIYKTGNIPVIKKQYTNSTQLSTDGYLYIYLTPDETAQLNPNNRYTHEVEWVVNSNTVYTILQGKLVVLRDHIRG